MVFTNKNEIIILPIEKEDEIENFLVPGFIGKEKVYEMGDVIEVYEYYYHPDDNVVSVIYDYSNERIIIIPLKVSEILEEIEDQILGKIVEKHGNITDEQVDFNYCIEVYYPDYYTATSDDHSILSSSGYWDYLEIELYRPINITTSLMKIEKVKITIPAWVNIGSIHGTKIISVGSDAILNALAKILDIRLE